MAIIKLRLSFYYVILAITFVTKKGQQGVGRILCASNLGRNEKVISRFKVIDRAIHRLVQNLFKKFILISQIR